MEEQAPHSGKDRASAEAQFHDARIEQSGARLAYVYRSVADVYRFTDVPESVLQGNLLELGCFRGEKALRLRGMAGHYRGIDISPGAVEHCRGLGLPDAFSFAVDDANRLETVADSSIDFAFGDGVLHHLDLEAFCHALSRKLSPKGFARFVEPAQGNVVLRAFRAMTPNMRTDDERPLDDEAMATLARHFDVRVQHHALLRPFVPMLFGNVEPVMRWSRSMDQRLLRWSWMQSQAWMLTLELFPKAPARRMAA